MALTLSRLREVLDYDPQTGIFTWRERGGAFKKSLIGQRAGRINSTGYRQIHIDGRRYSTNQLAWFYVTGEWPPHQVDHRDLDSSNDRFANLRPASASQNSQNKRLSCNNTSGFKGVSRITTSGKFRAEIWSRGVRHWLGTFDTKEDAAAAYAKAANDLHGEFARLA